MIFFSLQLFFGEAGIIAYIQKKNYTINLYDNIKKLIHINEYLQIQKDLAQNNNSYLIMNAHRVGLLSKNEFLIITPNQIFVNANSYTPGKIFLKKNIFNISNIVLFCISVLLTIIFAIIRKILLKDIIFIESKEDQNDLLNIKSNNIISNTNVESLNLYHNLSSKDNYITNSNLHLEKEKIDDDKLVSKTDKSNINIEINSTSVKELLSL